MFKKWSEKLDKALGNPSHLNSSIPEKRKAKENEYKDTVHTLTGGTAYPGQAQKEDTLSSAAAAASFVEERDIEEAVQHSLADQPAVDTDLITALDQSALEAAMQESASLVEEPPAASVDVKESSLHLVLRLRGKPETAGAELSGENSDIESDS